MLERNLYGGLKKVEQKLGLRRQFPDREGAWAMETFRAYVKTGDEKLRSELLAYTAKTSSCCANSNSNWQSFSENLQGGYGYRLRRSL